MLDYQRFPTSAEVFLSIKKRHPELKLFSSYSAPCGDYLGGNTSIGVMVTSYCFDSCDCPLVEAKTTWDIDEEAPHKRKNEMHEYWICFPNRAEA